MSWWQALAHAGFAGTEGALERAQSGLGDALRTTRFLRGRLAFEARPDDVYVVTYPRSGTTWVQFILYLLRSDRAVDFDHISQVSPWWERSLALGSRRAEDFEAFASPRVFKSHLPRRWLPSSGRFIYIVRDGLDVAVSYHHLYRSHLGFDGDFSAFFDRFMAGRLQYRSWFKHVQGWRRFETDPDVLVLRYEDLRSELEASIRRMAGFLAWPIDESVFPEVVEKAGFAYMKAHEERFDPITETLLDQGLHRGRFIRAGESGSGQSAVTDDMRARFEAALAQRHQNPAFEARLPDFLH